MKKMIISATCVCLMALLIGCNEGVPSSDQVQKQQQEVLMAESNSRIGMPSIVNFREKKLLKDIYELRDQQGLVTYTYLWNEFNGKLVFFCNSIGYGIPYATQFTNPQKVAAREYQTGYAILPQADPNGLFSPPSADGTWVMCKDPNGPDAKPVFVEPRIVVSPFKLEK
jgi:hypothetical protein